MNGRRCIETVTKQYVSKGSLYCKRLEVVNNRHLVATPIGCLDDISQRALSVLKNVDIILAEDTRTTGFLLSQYLDFLIYFI